ncbi:hypothetical protein J7T55_013859 [Diaporthe amygdali]|uniref:uncharacterized protein n=1 Tax=Phomopsis amygdali TaxID=1214568 RepID=UPI0022FDB4AC|nr:uncharacterized protein J7T55_013859 [Diaporthe amygdali]KAJ0119656.1 hypothetical protein J7T55_013859 [Diaporthe amygdali]
MGENWLRELHWKHCMGHGRVCTAGKAPRLIRDPDHIWIEALDIGGFAGAAGRRCNSHAQRAWFDKMEVEGVHEVHRVRWKLTGDLRAGPVLIGHVEDPGRRKGNHHQINAHVGQLSLSMYYWSREPWPQARGRATRQHGASITRSYTPEPSSEVMPGREKTPAGKSPKRVRWRDVKEGDDGLSTPPHTPQLGRLGTPELELRANCDKFCDCCSDEQMYREERSKMDSQIESALAHIRGSSGRKLLTAGSDGRRAR